VPIDLVFLFDIPNIFTERVPYSDPPSAYAYLGVVQRANVSLVNTEHLDAPNPRRAAMVVGFGH
jgi:hypothetical protein